MTIIPRAEWGARAATNRTIIAPSRRTALVVHYDGGEVIPVPSDEAGCAAQIRAAQNFHMNGNGWADLGYNFWICQHGSIFEGRGWDVLGAHAGPTGNVVGIGVQIHIGGAQAPTDAALGALQWLKGQADAHCGRTLLWKGHRDYMSTSCPGEPLYSWVQSGATGGGAPSQPSAPWDGSSFPGTGAFVLGQSHPAVTLLGQRLVAHGWTGYSQGPGPTFTATDKAGVAWFQAAQGWTGADADGYPGHTTWARLMAPAGAAPAPTPPAAPPARPQVSVSRAAAAFRHDSQPSVPTGAVSYPEVIWVEKALAAKGLLDPRWVDGSGGSRTVQAYAALQRAYGYSGRDADGIPGTASMTRLAHETGLFDPIA